MEEYRTGQGSLRIRSQSLETAALILGGVSVVACTCMYASVICGALAIILASLSRGGAYTYSRKALTALGLGIGGLILSVCAYSYSYYVLVQRFGSLENALKAYGFDLGGGASLFQ